MGLVCYVVSWIHLWYLLCYCVYALYHSRYSYNKYSRVLFQIYTYINLCEHHQDLIYLAHTDIFHGFHYICSSDLDINLLHLTFALTYFKISSTACCTIEFSSWCFEAFLADVGSCLLYLKGQLKAYL